MYKRVSSTNVMDLRGVYDGHSTGKYTQSNILRNLQKVVTRYILLILILDMGH